MFEVAVCLLSVSAEEVGYGELPDAVLRAVVGQYVGFGDVGHAEIERGGHLPFFVYLSSDAHVYADGTERERECVALGVCEQEVK